MARTKKNPDAPQAPEWHNNPSSEDVKRIKACIVECEEFFREIENAKESIKDIFNDLHEKTGIPKRTFNFLAKSYFDGTTLEKLSKNNEIQDLYDQLEQISIESVSDDE